MGRIKTKYIKRKTKELLSKYPDSFEKEFDGNKNSLMSISIIPSKKIRNIIAGYATRLVKKSEDL
ncbi:MAG TPA: 30S ribosomal protein S17e [Candidatus Woesearchaeota archaeon]|jgi:small subunit ribosomal protein S17e|nr:30S ribosomal protein S17e [Candidatus Woesearchaeota archaeon]